MVFVPAAAWRARTTVFVRIPRGLPTAKFGCAPQLSPLLAGEKQREDILTYNREWYSAQGVALHVADGSTGMRW